jgi:hypothetical protein
MTVRTTREILKALLEGFERSRDQSASYLNVCHRTDSDKKELKRAKNHLKAWSMVCDVVEGLIK